MAFKYISKELMANELNKTKKHFKGLTEGEKNNPSDILSKLLYKDVKLI